MDLFWNRTEGRLRTLWRLLAQAAIMVVLASAPILLIAEPLTALHRRGMFLTAYNKNDYDRIINMIVGPIMTAGVIGSVVLARTWLDHRRVETLGVRFDRAWWSGLLGGAAVGLEFTFSAVKVLCVGVYEEFVSRGYHLRNLADGLTLPWGIVASSSVFSPCSASRSVETRKGRASSGFIRAGPRSSRGEISGLKQASSGSSRP